MSSPASSSSRPPLETGEHDGEPILPARLTRNDYAAYASLVRSLEQREHPLADKLVSFQSIRDRVNRDVNAAYGEEGEAELSSGFSSGLEEEYLPSEDDVAPVVVHSTRSKRPNRAEAHADIDVHRAKKSKTNTKKLDDRWPLGFKQLIELETPLDEVILDIAYTQIRRNNLRLPGTSAHTGKHAPRGTGAAAKVDGEMQRDADDIIISSTLVQETKTYLNRVLIELAGLRPMNFGNRRDKMGPMGWQGVLDAAAILQDTE